MSTKQTVLYSLMIFFLILTLVTMGLWFKSSMELNDKNNIVTALEEKRIALDQEMNGLTSDRKRGLLYEVDDEQDGLAKKLKDLDALVPTLKSNPNDPANPGVAELEKQFNDLAPEVKKAWTEDAVKSLDTYKADRLKQEEDLKGATDRLVKQRKEKLDKEAAAEADLKQEEANKEAELKKIAQETTKMTQELDSVRLEHEGVQQKVTEVSRDLSKVREVVPQGRIISFDNEGEMLKCNGKPLFKNGTSLMDRFYYSQLSAKFKTAMIDIGTRDGVRKGMIFDVYSGMHRQLVKKALLEVVDPGPFSSRCVLLEPNREMRWDPVTGYVPVSSAELYSKFAAGGPDETDAVELIKRKSVKDRVEAIRLEKIAKEQGLEAAERARDENAGSDAPPVGLTLSLSPVGAGDWIFNPDFVPLVSSTEFHKQIRDELKSMRDVNVGTLTFYIADTVRAYRKEYLRRLCERNGCKISDVMSPNVNFVVVGSGFTRADLLEEKLASTKGKEDVKEDVKQQRTTLQALVDAKKYAADVLAEDEMESFFDRRQRKQELLRGKAVQPGRSTFFIAGKTKYRSPELLARYIQDHGGLVSTDIEAKVDYVVVGESPDDAFVEKIKKLGLKIIREDELAELLGVQ